MRFLGWLFAALLVAPPASATTWIRPQEPLSEDQWLEYDLSGADVVGIGIVVATKDTVVNIDPNDGAGFLARSVVISVERLLKGTTAKQTLHVGFSGLDDQPLRDRTETLQSIAGRRRVLFMLKSVDGGWEFKDGPNPSGTGLRLIPDDDALETKVRTIVAAQNPDSILSRASLVVIGRGFARMRTDFSAASMCGHQGGFRSDGISETG